MSQPGTATSRPGFLRRHKVVTALLALLSLLLAAVVGAAFWVNHQLGGIDRYESGLRPEQRVAKPTEGPAAEAVNILLLGADKGTGSTIEAELADGEWSRGAFRSDTIMIAHLPADRSHAYVVSIPRDSYVPVRGYGNQKINAAFSYGGPDLALETVEQVTGVHIDHVAMLDWAGFKDLTTAIGGVSITVPDQGTVSLSGEEALDYVRVRETLPNGDFDRIKRQQNFIRATMQKATSQGTLANPVKLKDLLSAVTENTTVDDGFSTGQMRDIAADLRSLRGDDVTYLTAPLGAYDDVSDVGSVVLLEPTESAALWRALATDDMPGYLERFAGDQLGAPSQVD
jgi:LCP family protein required for cell wall assembly